MFTLDDPHLKEVEDKEAWLRVANDTFSRQKKRGGKDEMCEALAIAAANAHVKELREATWTAAYINDLPDSAFLYIEPGGEKEDGKTKPRSLRHFPVYDEEGKLDLPHLRNALARIPQSKLDDKAKAKAQAKADKLAEKNLSSHKESAEMKATLKEVAGLSVNEMLDRLRFAVREKAGVGRTDVDGPWVKDTYDDYLVYEVDGKLFKVTYSFGADQQPTLGDPVEVQEETDYVPVGAAESAEAEIEGDFVALTEKAVSDDGILPVKIIEPGWGASGYYSPNVLEKGAAAYKAGTKMYWDHPTRTEERERPERSIRDLAAETIEDAAWDPMGPDGPGVYARAKVFGPYRDAVEELAPHIGLSHRALGTRKLGEAEGRKGPIVENIVAVRSVDFVTTPGAGGKIVEMFEAARKEEAKAHDIEWGEITLDGIKRSRPDLIESLRSEIKQAVYAEKKAMEEVKRMNDDEGRELQEAKANLEAEKESLLTEVGRLQEAETFRAAEKIVREKVGASELPEITKTRLIESLAKKPIVTDGKLDEEKFSQYVDEAIKSETEYVAKLTESGKVKGMGSGGGEGSGNLKESLTKLYMRQGKTKEDAETLAEAAANARR